MWTGAFDKRLADPPHTAHMGTRRKRGAMYGVHCSRCANRFSMDVRCTPDIRCNMRGIAMVPCENAARNIGVGRYYRDIHDGSGHWRIRVHIGVHLVAVHGIIGADMDRSMACYPTVCLEGRSLATGRNTVRPRYRHVGGILGYARLTRVNTWFSVRSCPRYDSSHGVALP
jgi:hypothetical protein